MTVLYRHSVLTAAVCACVQTGLSLSAAGQDVRPIMSDSVRWRALGCGTFGEVLRRRDTTPEVKKALDNVISCPEGPSVIAGLWANAATASVPYVTHLIGVSSIAERPIADALLRTLATTTLPTTVRMEVLGAFLHQLVPNYDRHLSVRTAVTIVGNDGRVIDSVRSTTFTTSSTDSPPTPIDAGLRAEIVAAIARIAADPGEAADMRVAARDVHEILSRRSP